MVSVAGKAKQTSSKKPAEPVANFTEVTDQMHALPVQQADDLMDCTENFPEGRQLEALFDTIEAYERQRRPVAKILGGNG